MSFTIDITLTADEMISQTKIRLRNEHPFFSYLLEFFTFVEDDSIPTIGVNKSGRVLYNPAMIESLTSLECQGVLSHEVLHIAYKHLNRGTDKTAMVNGISLFNIAADMVINQQLLENSFSLPKQALIPLKDSCKFGPVVIDNISKKDTETIYNELLKQFKDKADNNEDGVSTADESGQWFKSSQEVPKEFDKLMPDDDSTEAGETQGETPDWIKAVAEAYTYAKMQGKEPGGFKRLFEKLHKPKVNWRAVLRNTVQGSIPVDYTYSRPNKNFIAHDIFLPSLKKEGVKVICTIDTSGSISEDDIKDIVSEIVGIANTFQEVDFIIITHDSEVHDTYPLQSASRKDIKNLELHGGGGTDHVSLFAYIENKKDTWDMDSTVVVSFTDGFSEFPEKKPRVDSVLFILTKNHAELSTMPKWSRCITMQ